MAFFKEKANEVASQHKNVFSPQRGPIFSFDNAPIHQGADLQKLELDGPKRAPLSPSSPDMHKCIEHVFGTMVQAMQRCLARNLSMSTAEEYKAKVQDLFMSCITAESVQKDVASLKSTYRAIQAANGNWPERSLR